MAQSQTAAGAKELDTWIDAHQAQLSAEDFKQANILGTDMALESEHIDEGAAEAAVQRAREAMARKDLGSEESAAVQAALAKSLAQLHVKRRRRS